MMNSFMRAIERRRAAIDRLLPHISDGKALTVTHVFPAWKKGESYKAGERVRHNGALWRTGRDMTADAEPAESADYERVAG